MEESRLVVGLGNPGSKYEFTRHNLGFLVVRRLAEKLGLKFSKEPKFQGELATGKVGEIMIHLLLPTTFMNLSGISVRKVVDYYKVPFAEDNRFIVVVDDVYLKFGTLRLREQGGTAGHNGLKSIQAHLNSQSYPRLKVGIGPELESELPDGNESFLEDYVLGKFTADEAKRLSQVLDKGVSVLETWISLGREPAIQLAGQMNVREEEE
jgi:PTH1 family peptidyl-tRNA hydrolase